MVAGVVATGASALPSSIIEAAFRPQHGRTLNFGAFNKAVEVREGDVKRGGGMGVHCRLGGWMTRRRHGHSLTLSLPPPPPLLCPSQSLNAWYESRGILGQVVDADMKDGICELKVTEAIVSKVEGGGGGGEGIPHMPPHYEGRHVSQCELKVTEDIVSKVGGGGTPACEKLQRVAPVRARRDRPHPALFLGRAS